MSVGAVDRRTEGLTTTVPRVAKRNEFGEPVEFVVDGHPVLITSPEKVLFPKPGLTKLDLANYYVSVGPALMRWIHDRPVLLERYPNGVDGESF